MNQLCIFLFVLAPIRRSVNSSTISEWTAIVFDYFDTSPLWTGGFESELPILEASQREESL